MKAPIIPWIYFTLIYVGICEKGVEIKKKKTDLLSLRNAKEKQNYPDITQRNTISWRPQIKHKAHGASGLLRKEGKLRHHQLWSSFHFVIFHFFSFLNNQSYLDRRNFQLPMTNCSPFTVCLHIIIFFNHKSRDISPSWRLSLLWPSLSTLLCSCHSCSAEVSEPLERIIYGVTLSQLSSAQRPPI